MRATLDTVVMVVQGITAEGEVEMVEALLVIKTVTVDGDLVQGDMISLEWGRLCKTMVDIHYLKHGLKSSSKIF